MGTKSKQRKRFKTLPLVLVGGVILILAAVFVIAGLSNGSTTKVPNLSGMTVGDAEKALYDAELKLNTVGEIPSETVPEGSIVSQIPAAGDSVEKESVVKVKISVGLGEGYVPDLKGMKPEEAEKALAEAGYAGKGSEVDGVGPAGLIIDQSVKAGKEKKKGETIGYSVSRGNMVYVPNVIGLYADDAAAKLQAAGLKPAGKAKASKKDPGIVIGQSQSGIAYIGSTVTMTISGGEDYEEGDFDEYL